MRARNACLMAVLALALCACTRHSLTPKSGGRPYEVVVVDDIGNAVARELQQPTVGLPQEEPQFDVRAIKGSQYNLAAQTARSIVVTATDERLTRTQIRYERDAVARPQLIVYLTAPNTERLQQDAHMWGPQLRKLFNRHERNIAISYLQENRNTEAERRIDKMFGATMLVPADMQSWKEGKDFLWFSTNTVEDVRNICIYSIPRGRDFADMRDSVMKVNLPGETNDMYVLTVRNSLNQEERGERREERVSFGGMVWRGLWEMKNDAMGGPFVALLANDEQHGRMLVAEAFVYAPETNKRNKMRLTEAALYTLRLNQ